MNATPALDFASLHPGYALYPRHCERSEAIHRPAQQEWIASSHALLAMT
jgi:hypothetical protein